MKRISLIIALAALSACGAGQTDTLASLEEGWMNPPQEARTRVWWHWMNGNITKDGIRKDLEWMKASGLGGVHNFDAALGTPTVVDKRLIYMDEGWQDAFAYAVRMADSLDLEFTVASAPGWSSTGGPWVEPRDAMKKLVWSSAVVSGAVDMALPEPPHTTGAFLDGAPAGRGFAGSQYEHYEDVAVLAVRLPEGRKSAAELGAVLTVSGGGFTMEQLTNGSLADGVLLPREDKAGFAWIQYSFPEAVTVRSLRIVGAGGGGFGGGPATTWLEASDDGVSFAKVCDLRGGSVSQATLSVPATTARYFRACFRNPASMGGGFFGMGGGPSTPARGTMVAEFELYPYTAVHRFEDKSGFSTAADMTAQATPSSEGELFPGEADVIDITKNFKKGNLTWNAPAGRWKVLRYGWSLTGKQNHPAPAEATGLEVDKLDPEAWTRYFHTYLDMYKKASGGLMGERGVQYVLTDSYEAECETWTPAMFSEFKARRGYDLTPWLPVLSGEVIVSPEKSDAFLFDWRATLGELIADNYTLLSKIAREDYGMLGRYTEAHEAGRAFVGDGMDLKATAEVPMSAMWVLASWLPRTPDGEVDRSVYCADDRESASVAHIYGQNIAAAESMTAWGNGVAYSYHPGNLKAIADLELANGINRFVIHESAHQPDDVHVPGMSLGGIGQWFNRHDSWAPMAYVWGGYMARSCYMLQAGKNVADILYYYGEDSNVTTVFNRAPEIPSGYQWDYLNPDGLLSHISYKKGSLVSTGGTAYKVLWMDRNMDYMSVKVLRKIASLAKSGAWIGGVRPGHPASAADNADEFARLVADIWDSGKPNVVETGSLQEFLDRAGVAPDVTVPGDVRFLHRTLPGAEVYWVNKPSREARTLTLSFRTAGLRPQIWHPDNGLVEDASYEVKDGRTEVTVPMVQDDALFVVFAGPGIKSFAVPAVSPREIAKAEGPWAVSFQTGRGAPETAVFETLGSYTESSDKGIKYFSGIASYRTKLTLPSVEGRVVLDLGAVADLCEVYVNGRLCGAAWKAPYTVDITDAAKEGDNDVEVRVANVWVNRLVGDEQPGAVRVGWTDARSYNGTEPLLPAGLLGPVRVLSF